MFIKFKTENLIAKLQNLNRNFTFSWVSLIGFSTTWPEGATLLGWPKSINHKNYNFLDCDWFKKLLFPTNSLVRLLSDSLLSDTLLSDSLLSDSSISQSHSEFS